MRLFNSQQALKRKSIKKIIIKNKQTIKIHMYMRRASAHKALLLKLTFNSQCCCYKKHYEVLSEVFKSTTQRSACKAGSRRTTIKSICRIHLHTHIYLHMYSGVKIILLRHKK